LIVERKKITVGCGAKARARGAGIWGQEGAIQVQHEQHPQERKGCKDGSTDFINSVVLKSGAALKEVPGWTG
jgi:hypothetical protein